MGGAVCGVGGAEAELGREGGGGWTGVVAAEDERSWIQKIFSYIYNFYVDATDLKCNSNRINL